MKQSTALLLLVSCFLGVVSAQTALSLGVEEAMDVYSYSNSTNSTGSAINSTVAFEKLFIIVLSHQSLASAIQEEYLSSLTSKGTLLTHYVPISRISQPNYIAMIAGDKMNVNDDAVHDISGPSIVDIFESQGISWTAYVEDYPTDPTCFAGNASSDNSYLRKHNPFISFDNIRNNETLCSRIVNANKLAEDLQNNALSQYSMYLPNAQNSGYASDITVAGRWLNGFLSPLTVPHNPFLDGLLIVVTFDTSGDNSPVYTLLLGGI
jgi:acid phosphatase